MWFGHLISGLIISIPFGFDTFTILASIFFSWLPNIDVFFVKLGFLEKNFHGGPTHSFLFSTVVGLIVGTFSLKFGAIAFSCILLHCLCDLPTDAGINFFYPFKKNVSLNLWKETGYWGLKSIDDYYKQKWAKILELLIAVIFIILYLGFYF
jgi:membrane-bound metal-dependent hydrolase YbcI (DUF457 family)